MLSIAALMIAFANAATADIFQWEYINPADPSQGKRQSTTLTPSGADVDAVPGAVLTLRNLTMAYLNEADLNHATLQGTILQNASLRGANLFRADLSTYRGLAQYGYVFGADLTAADLREANLANANFDQATLTDADFTDADVREASFARTENYPYGTGITLAQLYSTASYQAHDLTGISLGGNDLVGGKFAGQKLTNSTFEAFAYFDSRFVYLARLMETDFTAADLTNANFGAANLASANFRDANLANAAFAGFVSCPHGLCFEYATLTDANLTAADARGAYLFPSPAEGITSNLIRPDGHLNGLDLDAGNLLVARDYDGGSAYLASGAPIPITVDQHLAMGPGGTLRMVFEADAWDSTISFAPGIPVTLGGTLELTFAAEVNLASQVGRTFDLFDWSGVHPAGAFAISSPYAWDLSNLYISGEVMLTSVPEPRAVRLLSLALTALVAIGRIRLLFVSPEERNQ
jgi:uncharacterized protein YjbI with pentapeptide repeats